MSRLDLEAEKKRYVKDMGADIEQLKDRQREIAAEIKAGGRQIPLWGGAEKTETDAGAEKN